MRRTLLEYSPADGCEPARTYLPTCKHIISQTNLFVKPLQFRGRKEGKMTYHDMCQNCIEIQCQTVFCYYNAEKEKRVIITQAEAEHREIRYIYTEDDAIYIKVEVEG